MVSGSGRGREFVVMAGGGRVRHILGPRMTSVVRKGFSKPICYGFAMGSEAVLGFHPARSPEHDNLPICETCANTDHARLLKIEEDVDDLGISWARGCTLIMEPTHIHGSWLRRKASSAPEHSCFLPREANEDYEPLGHPGDVWRCECGRRWVIKGLRGPVHKAWCRRYLPWPR